MTAGAKLPWQVASAVCVRGLQVAVASCDRCMCGIMAGCYRNLRSPYVRGLRLDWLLITQDHLSDCFSATLS